MGTAASHLARGKAAVAAFLDLVPEFEKSMKKSIGSPTIFGQLNTESEVLYGEVVEDQ